MNIHLEAKENVDGEIKLVPCTEFDNDCFKMWK